MGKTHKSPSIARRSPESILQDIAEMRDARNSTKKNPSANKKYIPVSAITCPQADAVIPQRNLESFVRYLTAARHERLNFWKEQYEQAMPAKPFDPAGDCEDLAQCPVCQEELPKSKIMAHADECATKKFMN